MNVRYSAVSLLVLTVSVSAILACASSPVRAQKAVGQLRDIAGPTGKIPEVPPPTKVDTSTGTAGGYNVGGSTTTTQGTSGGSSQAGKKEKTGTERAR